MTSPSAYPTISAVALSYRFSAAETTEYTAFPNVLLPELFFPVITVIPSIATEEFLIIPMFFNLIFNAAPPKNGYNTLSYGHYITDYYDSQYTNYEKAKLIL